MIHRDHAIAVLNDLIEITLDSQKGYGEAAEQSHDPIIKDLFRRWAAERRRVAGDLRRAVRELGGLPERKGSALASAHRAFLDLRAFVSGDDRPVVQEVERGEHHIESTFEDALADETLDHRTRSAIQAAFASIKRGHEDMRELRKTYENP